MGAAVELGLQLSKKSNLFAGGKLELPLYSTSSKLWERCIPLSDKPPRPHDPVTPRELKLGECFGNYTIGQCKLLKEGGFVGGDWVDFDDATIPCGTWHHCCVPPMAEYRDPLGESCSRWGDVGVCQNPDEWECVGGEYVRTDIDYYWVCPQGKLCCITN
ncbi:hypothetical protein VTO42DRAFT_5405 [Malbranchea cinnamomea]